MSVPEKEWKDAIQRAMTLHTVPEILEQNGVQVTGGRCKAVCHEGTHLTAKVSDELYYCFKCNKRMNVIDLTMHFNACSFRRAVEILGGTRELTPEERERAEEKARLAESAAKERSAFEKEFHHWNTIKRFYKSLLDEVPEMTPESAHWYALYRWADEKVAECFQKYPEK